MKRFIAAVSFAVLAAPAFAAGKPFEQLDLDRALPEVNIPSPAPASVEQRSRTAAYSGDTRSDSEIATQVTEPAQATGNWATGPWANDPYFIAPPL